MRAHAPQKEIARRKLTVELELARATLEDSERQIALQKQRLVDITVRARVGRLSGLSASHSKSGFVWGFCMGAQVA
jgi:hypothetical protein